MKVLMNAPYLFSRNVLTVTSQLIVVTFDRYVVAFDHCTFYWLQSRHKTKASKNILPHNEQTRQGCHRENFSCTQVRKNQIRQLSSTETAARCSWFRDEWEIVCVKFSRGGQFSKKKKETNVAQLAAFPKSLCQHSTAEQRRVYANVQRAMPLWARCCQSEKSPR